MMDEEFDKWFMEWQAREQGGLSGAVAYGAFEVWRTVLQAERERVRVLREALEDIVEYWNRDQNDQAMADALAVIITTAEEALATTEPEDV